MIDFMKQIMNGVFEKPNYVLLPLNPEADQPSRIIVMDPIQKALEELFCYANIERGVNERDHKGKIVEYHKAAGLKADYKTAWCSSFANYVVKRAGFKGTGSASARSWLKWGQSVDTPKMGAIVIFWRVSPDSSYGHVGFFAGEHEEEIIVLGGNQDNQVCLKTYPKERLIGVRVPDVKKA